MVIKQNSLWETGSPLPPTLSRRGRGPLHAFRFLTQQKMSSELRQESVNIYLIVYLVFLSDSNLMNLEQLPT